MAAQGAAVLAAERAAQAPLPQQQAQYNPRLPGRTMAVFHRNSRFSAILLYGSAVIWCREKKASLKKGGFFAVRAREDAHRAPEGSFFFTYRPCRRRASAGFSALAGMAQMRPKRAVPGMRPPPHKIRTLRAESPHRAAV